MTIEKGMLRKEMKAKVTLIFAWSTFSFPEFGARAKAVLRGKETVGS